MKILVTGTGGILGSEVCKYLSEKGIDVEAFNRSVFFNQSPDEHFHLLEGFDCIIHAAANTDVEGCEVNSRECYKDNTLFTERLAIASSKSNCKFIYISSTGIYGTGNATEPYTEFDPVKPTTHHHHSKWLGECAVNRYCASALVLRTGWLFGGLPESEKNFVARRIEEAIKTKNRCIFSNNTQIGVPTSIYDFTPKLYELLLNNEIGTFNLVNTNTASRFEYVSKIIELAEIDIDVEPVTASSFKRKANVSSNETAIALKLSMLGYSDLPCWSDSLESYIKDDLKEWITRLKNEQ